MNVRAYIDHIIQENRSAINQSLGHAIIDYELQLLLNDALATQELNDFQRGYRPGPGETPPTRLYLLIEDLRTGDLTLKNALDALRSIDPNWQRVSNLNPSSPTAAPAEHRKRDRRPSRYNRR